MNSIEILTAERDKLLRMAKVLDTSIAALGGEVSGGRGKKKRHVSAETRAKIAAAQKKRWSKEKKGEK